MDQQQKQDILDYCESNVLALGPLMERMLIHTRAEADGTMGTSPGLGQALYRGRYMTAVSRSASAPEPRSINNTPTGEGCAGLKLWNALSR